MRTPNADGEERRGGITFKHRGNELLCERCSEKEGKPIWVFSQKFAKTGQPMLQCSRCKRQDWWKQRKAKGATA